MQAVYVLSHIRFYDGSDIISIHTTKKSAWVASRQYLLDRYKNWDEERRKYGFEDEHERSMDWEMNRLKIIPYNLLSGKNEH